MLRLAAAQRARGHDARLACDTLRPGDLPERAREFGVPLQEGLVLSVKAGPVLLLRDILALGHLWAGGSFDVLHAHRTHDHTLAVLSRPRRSQAVLVRTLHTERSFGPGRRWLLRRADGLVTVCRAHLERLQASGLLAADRIVAVEGAVDGARFFPQPEDLRVRQEWNLTADVPVAGMVARMKADRGHRRLLEAWREVAQRLPGARLLLAGRGEQEGELRRLAENLGLSASVVFIGYRQDLPSVYRALDLKVMLAPGNDGTCRAALEAMACGVPVLAARRGALAEIVTEGRTGFLVPPDDTPALAEMLYQALSDRIGLRRLGAEAAAEARRRFSVARQLEPIEALYRRLLFADRPRRGNMSA